MRRGVFLALSVLGSLASAVPASAQGCSVERISVDAAGAESDGISSQVSITPDGRFVVFVSTATNLVPGDVNGVADVFVRDLRGGTIERVSVGAGGIECDLASSYPSISENGRWVAFNTGSAALDAGDTNNALDVYLRDRWNDTTERVSLGVGGVQGDGPSFGATLAAGARYVAFVSWAANLVPGDSNATRDVFLLDRDVGTLERVSVSTSGVEGDDLSGSGTLLSFVSRDGRFVVFGSVASNLAPGDTNQTGDVFLRDRFAGTTTMLVRAQGGGAPIAGADPTYATPDGGFVGFVSASPDLVAGDTNGGTDAFVLDRAQGLVERVSLTSAGTESVGESWATVVSSDGRFALFSSDASDFVANDAYGHRDLFRRDRVAGTTERFVPGDGSWTPREDLFSGSLTAAGDRVAFAYAGDDLVFPDLNGFGDVLVSTCLIGSTFCSGDGSALACPCGTGTWKGGCPNSVGDGATLSASGVASVSGDTLMLSVRDLPPHTSVLFVQGSIAHNGGNGLISGDGLRCVTGSGFARLATLYAPDGRSRWGFGATGSPPLSVQGGVSSGGITRLYHAQYRNPAPFCTSATFNSTNALEILWAP